MQCILLIAVFLHLMTPFASGKYLLLKLGTEPMNYSKERDYSYQYPPDYQEVEASEGIVHENEKQIVNL